MDDAIGDGVAFGAGLDVGAAGGVAAAIQGLDGGDELVGEFAEGDDGGDFAQMLVCDTEVLGRRGGRRG